MTIGINASRTLTTAIGYILSMGLVFLFTVTVFSESSEVFKNTNPEELGLYTIIMMLLTTAVVVGFMVKGWFYKSAQFWKHACAIFLTTNVIVGAYNLSFDGPSELLATFLEYHSTNYAIVLNVLAIGSFAVFAYFKRSPSAWEWVWQPVMVLTILVVGATITFGFSATHALTALAAFQFGYLLPKRLREASSGEKRQRSASEEVDLDSQSPALASVG